MKTPEQLLCTKILDGFQLGSCNSLVTRLIDDLSSCAAPALLSGNTGQEATCVSFMHAAPHSTEDVVLRGRVSMLIQVWVRKHHH